MVENIQNIIESGYDILDVIKENLIEERYEEVLQMWEVVVGIAGLECEACEFYRKSCKVSSIEKAKRLPALTDATKTLKALQYRRISSRTAIALLNEIYVSLLGCAEERVRLGNLDQYPDDPF